MQEAVSLPVRFTLPLSRRDVRRLRTAFWSSMFGMFLMVVLALGCLVLILAVWWPPDPPRGAGVITIALALLMCMGMIASKFQLTYVRNAALPYLRQKRVLQARFLAAHLTMYRHQPNSIFLYLQDCPVLELGIAFYALNGVDVENVVRGNLVEVHFTTHANPVLLQFSLIDEAARASKAFSS